MSAKMKFKRKHRIQLHNSMRERAEQMLALLDSCEPGDIPDDTLAGLICRDVETTAKFLRRSFET